MAKNVLTNPTVSSEITAHSDGGNVRLNLAGMAVTRVSADAGGGNMDGFLPDNADSRRFRGARLDGVRHPEA
jgi:hypothetical protein